jgi:hypothetical protein
MSAIPNNVPARARLTEPMKKIESTTAVEGGKTFHAVVFSTVNAAFAVEVIRLASAPGRRSAK